MKPNKLLQKFVVATMMLQTAAYAASPLVEVYKTSTCGCCKEWVKHLEKNGFTVRAHDVDHPSAYREKYGLPQSHGSCHTGVVAGYAIEGHVPASDIKRLLAEKPKAKGLAVPAMPMGSPGMEGPRSDAYDVFLIKEDGRHSVYHHYDAK